MTLLRCMYLYPCATCIPLKSNETPHFDCNFRYTTTWSYDAAHSSEVAIPKGHSPKSSRSRLVWARLTGISVCFLSSRRN
jgi:hypothetical protein